VTSSGIEPATFRLVAYSFNELRYLLPHVTKYIQTAKFTCLNVPLDRLCGLVSSGQSSWLQIQSSGFDSWRYQIFFEVVGLERGPLSLANTTEGLLERKSSDFGLEYGLGIRHADHAAPSLRKSWHELRRLAAVARAV
jgi:hypothetical protein